jgi:two-component system, LuxR family, response regulator FixJ
MPETFTVHLVDDDRAMCQSMILLLDSAGLACLAYESAAKLLEALPDISPGCIVTDVQMPGMDGLELLKRIVASAHGLPVVLMTGHGDVQMAVEAMKQGAADFVEKPFSGEAMLSSILAIRDRCRRGEALGATSAAFLARVALLTPREREVFDCLIMGESTKQIARRLAISPRTVDIHRANIINKMEVTSSLELIRLGARIGLA